MPEKRNSRILYHSNRLFLSAGYRATTMRQIAEAAQVSLGLTTYHFTSKRQIAVQVIETYLRYLGGLLDRHIAPAKQPLVHSAAMIRLCIEFFLDRPCRQFYLECLQQEIYMEAVQKLGNSALGIFAAEHHIDISDDLLLLFDNYIPPSVEKILLLEKEKGNFPGIPYDQIPDIVFSIAVERHLDQQEILRAAQDARHISRKVLATIPPDILSTLFDRSQSGHAAHAGLPMQAPTKGVTHDES